MKRYVSSCSRPASRQKTLKGKPERAAMSIKTTSSAPLKARAQPAPKRDSPQLRISLGGLSRSSRANSATSDGDSRGGNGGGGVAAPGWAPLDAASSLISLSVL